MTQLQFIVYTTFTWQEAEGGVDWHSASLVEQIWIPWWSFYLVGWGSPQTRTSLACFMVCSIHLRLLAQQEVAKHSVTSLGFLGVSRVILALLHCIDCWANSHILTFMIEGIQLKAKYRYIHAWRSTYQIHSIQLHIQLSTTPQCHSMIETSFAWPARLASTFQVYLNTPALLDKQLEPAWSRVLSPQTIYEYKFRANCSGYNYGLCRGWQVFTTVAYTSTPASLSYVYHNNLNKFPVQ